ncbi:MULTISPECIES: LysR family transcriptional regulator ArgP [Cobetia]|uniref:LysR family transcriptional regulator ArgP n=1 Tax=Cobetia crustatorum TaxID=553385 RepID=A0A558HN96_9GAMM|nr:MULTISPECIES: LysR family transcriptional regulator ArgP [Cobetia]TVU70613.1 LysR family transcriptional regulator ArgP [Cobetia crustatorum]
MLDYKLLEALAAVIDQAGFERGARALGLTQSAVSQRIKLLEARLGQPVLVRTPRLGPTPLGRRLLNHVQQVRLLEHDLLDQIPALGESEQRLRIAINADSLATWWPKVTGIFCQERDLLLDMLVEDQEVALKRMRDGEVAGCICATPRPVQGARSHPLGSMRYRALASPDFVRRYLIPTDASSADHKTDSKTKNQKQSTSLEMPEHLSHEVLRRMPAIVFGRDDKLQHRLLSSMGFDEPFPHHLCPSSEGFVRLALSGMGYGMIPEQQARHLLESGELIDIAPNHALEVPLYWHHWRHGGNTLERLTDHLLRHCESLLLPMPEQDPPRPGTL